MISVKNILFYIPSLSQESGGIRQYAAALLEVMKELDDDHLFFIYHNGEDPVIMDKIKNCSKFIHVTHAPSIIPYKYEFKKRIKNFIKRKVNKKSENELEKIIEYFNINIIHCPYQYLPSILNENLPKVKIIITMHDVQELRFPEFFTPQQRAERAVNFMNYIKDADRVVVSYDHVKEDIQQFFQKDSNLVSVLLLKMDNLWFKNISMSSQNEYNIEFSKYILYPANFWKHKNHQKLIEAIYILKTEKNLNVNLILTGDYEKNQGPCIADLIVKYKLESQVKMLGIVDEQTLYTLYIKSLGVVIPTLYEAGSFPLMESIFLEVPVICSNVTSLPETIGDVNYIFNPNSIDELVDKIELLWTNEEFRLNSKSNCKKRQPYLINTNAKAVLENIYCFN